ncbi:hypothetical protein BGX38DRAFT_1223184 [Terfezia claveryi]|nr:hypothetical protein BGX38DRAFT_1223184 [Terfezia claveryi]
MGRVGGHKCYCIVFSSLVGTVFSCITFFFSLYCISYFFELYPYMIPFRICPKCDTGVPAI